mgnify:FL=1
MKQRWQMRIATLAVGALLGVVGTGYAKSLPTYDTTKATAEAQTFEARGVHSESDLPAAYQSYATTMITEIRDYSDGYTFTVPWRLTNGVMNHKLKMTAAPNAVISLTWRKALFPSHSLFFYQT